MKRSIEGTVSSERPLWMLGARELAEGFRARLFSPVEALDAVLDRAREINVIVNAIVTFDREGAHEAARASEQRWRKEEALGPFDGVPLTVKDNIHVKGLRATWGSRIFADNIAAEDELPVARLRAQGAVFIGKTNCPEFTLQGYTGNPLFGVTRNPWDPRLTPGGSSGGAVAAVASGVGPVALATDGGGSIRRPASHAGLVGLKPSAGRIARSGGFPAILHDMEAIGPIARTTADASLVFSILAKPDPRDRASLAFATASAGTDTVPPPQRILYVPRFGNSPVDAQIAANVSEAASNLARLGHIVVEGTAPFDPLLIDRIWSVIGPVGLAWLLSRYPAARERASTPLLRIADQGTAATGVEYADALDEIARLRARMADFFSRFDMILTPSAAALPWPAEVTHPESIDGQPVGPRGHAVFTAVANAAGIPAISLPCRPSSDGLPIGFQLLTRSGADERLLQLCNQYEQAHAWADRWPPLGL